ncbi:hypothetical protein K458DRAFT_397101 [Lentithecium fluviatile CBS 122367]|uniref:Uncharacterized protein n=1 Tax=Lentithecium fluviatile CBS 122367 TaxID=1168545 RepID=A0A6G1IE42_9PLEO|nr:hypothetical protein K458DRAFT_397101 [Lentithecium fluviatile CBS 122367]
MDKFLICEVQTKTDTEKVDCVLHWESTEHTSGETKQKLEKIVSLERLAHILYLKVVAEDGERPETYEYVSDTVMKGCLQEGEGAYAEDEDPPLGLRDKLDLALERRILDPYARILDFRHGENPKLTSLVCRRIGNRQSGVLIKAKKRKRYWSS